MTKKKITDILSKVGWTALNKTTHLTKRVVRVKSVITISRILIPKLIKTA